MLAPAQAWEILRSAEVVYSEDDVAQAVARLAQAITAKLAGANPVVLVVMGGAVVFSGHLLPRLKFPLELDYLHLTRYGDQTQGGHIRWEVFPGERLRDRVVLVLDDILDEGHTAAAIRARVLQAHAAHCYIAVLTDKQIDRVKPIAADFVGLHVPDRFVFGFGMDVKGAWRNLPAIYAMKQD